MNVSICKKCGHAMMSHVCGSFCLHDDCVCLPWPEATACEAHFSRHPELWRQAYKLAEVENIPIPAARLRVWKGIEEARGKGQ
jgi:hypothetical protein